jgi:hypothetical protein
VPIPTTDERWIAPLAGFVKINVDVAHKKMGKTGPMAAVCQAVNRDSFGVSALVVHGISNPAILEAIACQEVIALGVDLNI